MQPPNPATNPDTTPVPKRQRHPQHPQHQNPPFPAALLQAASVAAAAARSETSTNPDEDPTISPDNPSAQLTNLVHLMRLVSSAAGLTPDTTDPTPHNTLTWLTQRLHRLHDHLQTSPMRRTRPSIISINANSLTDDIDALEGLEDVKVDSDDDLDIDKFPRRRSSKRSRLLFPRLRSALINNSSSNHSPVVPELPLDDDAPLFSARSSAACIDNRPHFRIPVGSAANSYLTHMSSWKSLGQNKANRLHRDYTKIFCREEKEPFPPDESSIRIAGGELYVDGSIFDRWELREKIGEGAYAIVRVAHVKQPWKGPQPPENPLAAVKIISKRNPEFYNEKMVSREVFSYRLLDLAGGHDSIVELYEVYEDEENVYLVMELLQGGELFTQMADRGQYTEKDAANMVVSMLAGLAFCHRHNLTHRDVKPENFVFMEPNGDDANIKLTDFGIAYYSEDPTALCKTLCGTPLYVAPEVLLRQPYGPEADLWSLGVIVYIMLVGYPPFDDNDIVQLVKKIKYRPVKFDGSEWMLISEEGKQFLANLLDKDKSNRMTAQQALEHDWLRNNCQAATRNVLEVAHSNLKSFVNRKRWRQAIQGVKAMNRITRMVEFSREGETLHETATELVGEDERSEFDELDTISAEKVEVVLVQRPEDANPPQYDSRRKKFLNRVHSTSSSSASETPMQDRKPPVQDTLERSSRVSMAIRYGSGGKKRISSLMPSIGKKPLVLPDQDSGSSMAPLPIDPAFESSDESTSLKTDRTSHRTSHRSAVTERYQPSGLTRMETSPVVGRESEETNARLGRTLTRGDAVVRKMSSHARKLVGKGGIGRRRAGASDVRPPVMLEMGEHRKQKKFPWFR